MSQKYLSTRLCKLLAQGSEERGEMLTPQEPKLSMWKRAKELLTCWGATEQWLVGGRLQGVIMFLIREWLDLSETSGQVHVPDIKELLAQQVIYW